MNAGKGIANPPDGPRTAAVTMRPKRNIEFGTVLIDRSPQQVWFASQCDGHLVGIPRTDGLASHRFLPVSEARTELGTPASDRLVGHDNTTLRE
ncbi:hypothetical protein R69749_06962 [Paraburkholderia domus]|nr:hypothetical protein R69749_06962 [Paraburkholderia domus]